MKKIPRISTAEWTVMKQLWRRRPQTAGELIETLSESTEWGPATIKTLLNRLLRKGALRHQKQGRAYWYSPAVSESDCQREEANSLLARVFDGSVSPLLAHLVESEGITPAELSEIEDLIKSRRAR